MNFFFTQTKVTAFIAALVLVSILGYIDLMALPAIALSVFYLIPIFQSTWFVGKQAGFFTAFVSAITFYFANSSIWNSGQNFIFFATFVYLLDYIKKLRIEKQKMAKTDFLTGLANSSLFFEFADLEIKRASRFKYQLTIAYIDIDNFKLVNEKLGYQIGNLLLNEVATTLKATLRMTDVIARLGGDEFAILLSETGYDPAKIVLNRVQSKLSEAVAAQDWNVTFSIAAVTFIKPPNSVEEMIERANNLMYFIKHNGKNMLKHERFGEPPESGIENVTQFK
ncbi:MAG: GGDEF domain-containing protein [Oscillatoriaceae bacterium SKW80]|nr:GGDEF domain-containing protein [Oscillatoriaceae bacterium SKYG93]MCX8120349.1 GGDEF domain-containing protein [Oscillatoriaceae bacterium SKW80]MDW8453275.1 GGDEF domain-containing protein [Oscillatoriaceae cyanobacterium SKYGB_i_bin93]